MLDRSLLIGSFLFLGAIFTLASCAPSETEKRTRNSAEAYCQCFADYTEYVANALGGDRPLARRDTTAMRLMARANQCQIGDGSRGVTESIYLRGLSFEEKEAYRETLKAAIVKACPKTAELVNQEY